VTLLSRAEIVWCDTENLPTTAGQGEHGGSNGGILEEMWGVGSAPTVLNTVWWDPV
jgi:hypothetical protein